MEILKIKVHHAQNVGKVQISREKQLPAPVGVISGKFVHGPENIKIGCVFLISLGGPMAAIQPVWEMVAIFLTWPLS